MNQNNSSCNNPDEFKELSEEEQATLTKWIADNIASIQWFNDKHTSYNLKHRFEEAVNGFYVTNGQFKGAMLKAGFIAKDQTALNWIFNVSQKSKCLQSAPRLV